MKAESLLLFLFLLPLFAVSQGKTNKKSGIPERIINIDFNQNKGPLNRFFNECIGAGRANEGLRADWQQQLAYVRKECGFKYIRMHGLLTDDMAVYKEDRKGNPIYNYMYVDALFDFLESIGMKPFVELGFMPNAIASGSRTIFGGEGMLRLPGITINGGRW